MRPKVLYLIILGYIFFSSCSSISDDLVFDDVPRIEIIEFPNDTLDEFIDTLRFSLRYEDGNGDLGSAEIDEYHLYVHDLRFPRADSFFIGLIGPLDINHSIQGVLHVSLPPVYITTNRSLETTSFEIRMRDRSGNISNTVKTEQLWIQ